MEEDLRLVTLTADEHDAWQSGMWRFAAAIMAGEMPDGPTVSGGFDGDNSPQLPAHSIGGTRVKRLMRNSEGVDESEWGVNDTLGIL